MASHFLFGIPFPFASTSTHPNHGCTLCSDCLIPGGLVFDYVMEVWDPPDTINLGIMCSARVTSRSHCTEFAFLGMEGFGKRWLWVMSTKNSPTEICLVWYCQLLDSMHPNQVVWQPYEAEFGHLPAYCLSGREMWTARVPLVCFWLVEKHTPNRVVCQFGMVQEIPFDVDTDGALHAIDLRGKTKVN